MSVTLSREEAGLANEEEKAAKKKKEARSSGRRGAPHTPICCRAHAPRFWLLRLGGVVCAGSVTALDFKMAQAQAQSP